MSDFSLYLLALMMGYGSGIATMFIYQWLLRRRQRLVWIRKNPRAHSTLVKRLQEEEWLER